MKMNFKIGENVFMTAGSSVMEARVECPRYGRYVVAYKGFGYEAEGRICVSGTRLFHSYDEAVANSRKMPKQNSTADKQTEATSVATSGSKPPMCIASR